MARTRTIRVAELFEPVDIDIFGTVFGLRVPTRSNEEKSAAKETELDEATESVQEKDLNEIEARKILMPLFFELLDLLLEPADEGEKKVHAKTIVKKLYDDDKIGLTTIRALITEIGNVRAEERRPT